MASRLTSLQLGPVIAALAAGVALGVYGGDAVFQRNINFTPDGNSTGAVLQVNGVTQAQWVPVACTATGGNVKVSGGAKYNTCIAASPLTTTGTIVGLGLECGSVPAAFAFDMSFVKSRTSGTGSAFLNLGNKSAGTGAGIYFLTGSMLWNPADLIKVGTLTSVNAATDCQLMYQIRDKYGS